MIDKDRLLKPRLGEEDYDVADVGAVRIRTLSWEECAELQSWTEKGRGTAAVYRRILHLALVDPALSEDEAATWMAAAGGGEIEAIVQRVMAMSGMVEGAQKSP